MKLSVLSSGSGGNSTIINSSDGSILIDAGITGKKLFERLESVAADAKNIMGIIITHDHHDHIDGAGVIARKLKIPVYIHRANYESSAEKLDKCEIIFIENEFKVGSFTIIPFPISHDGTANYAYNIISEGKKISHVTDIGIVTETVKFRIRDSDLLVMESNHDLKMLQDGPYPWYLKQRIAGNKGHLSNLSAATLIVELGCSKMRNLILAHLSKENNDPALAYDSMIKTREENLMNFNLHLACQNNATEFIEV
ncbi:MAG: hypothetical protein A2Y39_06455 [Candidatus Delongbacteria bacterium GWF2_40_14]|nr:MAG: hypothetical protein A2Y39_06455 [Candidatus Delongbacteria bacterium GWF2_40_14]